MTTDALRQITADACQRLKGKLWPNGLGIDKRRWTFIYAEHTSRWIARHQYPDDSLFWGWGETPEIAQAHARQRR